MPFTSGMAIVAEGFGPIKYNHMKHLRCIPFSLLFFYFIISSDSLYSQGFEGRLVYKIHYNIHNRKVKNACLEKNSGNNEVVTLKNGWYKAERKNSGEILGTMIYRSKDSMRFQFAAGENYCLRTKLDKDSAEKMVKKDTLVHIGAYLCEVYESKKGFSHLTWYILKGSSNYKETIWYPALTPFTSPVVKLVIRNKDYDFVQELSAYDKATINDAEFSTGSRMIIAPQSEVINEVVSSATKIKLQRCTGKKTGYPLFMQLQNLEGKVYVDFVIDTLSKVSYVKVTTGFFRNSKKIEKIKNCRKTERIRSKVEKRLLAAFSECVAGIQFNAPLTKNGKVNMIMRIPVIFGYYYSDRVEDSFDDDDNYEMYEDFYEKELL